jgi:hypothetical protein
MSNSLFAVARSSHSPAYCHENHFTSLPLTAARAHGPVEIKAIPSLPFPSLPVPSRPSLD